MIILSFYALTPSVVGNVPIRTQACKTVLFNVSIYFVHDSRVSERSNRKTACLRHIALLHIASSYATALVTGHQLPVRLLYFLKAKAHTTCINHNFWVLWQTYIVSNFATDNLHLLTIMLIFKMIVIKENSE